MISSFSSLSDWDELVEVEAISYYCLAYMGFLISWLLYTKKSWYLISNASYIFYFGFLKAVYIVVKELSLGYPLKDKDALVYWVAVN